ncbi:hypothetical protein GGH94_003984 [Coemansia aciculifera]|uniref:MICOS complex subunit n=1 Tax=Coemansia aciculifera TaxID=417176 RepID=A0A9W8IGB1_9FUNG|nr:hypothetical protein GGH94_003984 [Coemansia aciculifera]KAJ2872648.1 hypothetical protein GGH93_003838 [Coemansia aciculifera]
MAQQIARVATILGAASATAVAITTPVFADSKKSIYDEYPREFPTTPHQQPPTRIIALLREVRHEATQALNMAQVHGQIVVDRWIGVEKQVADVVRRTVPQGESLAPGVIYVGVAALAGPIFTRRRNFAVRWTSPLVFGAMAAAYFLPGTSTVVLRNVWGRYGDPQTIDVLCAKWQSVKAAERQLRARVAGNVQELRMSLQQGRGFGQNAVVAPIASAKAKAEELGQVAVEKVAEIVRDVKEPAKTVKIEKDQTKQLPLGFKDKPSTN